MLSSTLSRIESTQARQFDELRSEIRSLKPREEGLDLSSKGLDLSSKKGKRREKEKDLGKEKEVEPRESSTLPESLDVATNSPSHEISQMVTQLLHASHLNPPSKASTKSSHKKSDQTDGGGVHEATEGKPIAKVNHRKELIDPLPNEAAEVPKAVSKTSMKKIDVTEQAKTDVGEVNDSIMQRKSDPRLAKRSELKREKESGSLSDNGDDSVSRSPRPKKPTKKGNGTAKLSGEILDEAADDAVDERDIEESMSPTAEPPAGSSSPPRKPRAASTSSVPQVEHRLFENFQDEDDITVSEDEAFQQAWVELENQRQRKITSLGPKDIERYCCFLS